jgi:acyl dehydratase
MSRGVVLGAPVGPFPGRLDADLLRRYAAATDPSPGVVAGAAVPPVALVTQVWDAQNEARGALVPEELQRSATGGVHGEHDVVLHRPLVPGEPLRTWVEGHGARPARRNALVTLRYRTLDVDDVLVAEQWWTTVYLGATCDAVGDPPPDHAFPDGARIRPLGTYAADIDEGMARRYAEASGDWSPHHFDVAAARRSGVDRPFLHGLCTMALCAQAVVELVAGGDPDRVRRVAVRFAAPTLLGERLDVRLYDAGPLGVAFEADAAGAAVITHGRAELRPVTP